jgi:DNA-binding transcriptional LysR family regulator
MDRIDAMATLLAAVDTGSLSAASRALGMPLATVSRKVSELEAHRRTRLLIRTSRRLTLTEAGQAYVASARRILEEMDEAERAASGEYRAPRGHLTITAPIMFGRLHVEPVVLDFLKAYPDITVRLTLADTVLNLIDDHVDVAVRVGKLPDSRLMALRLGEIGWVACASPDYLAHRGEPDSPEELANHDCIMFEGLYSNNSWTFGRDRQVQEISVRPRFSVNSADAAIAAAIRGAGVTRVLSYQVAEPVARGALKVILQAFEPDLLPVHLLYADQSLIPLKLRAFLDFAGPRLRSSLSALERASVRTQQPG